MFPASYYAKWTSVCTARLVAIVDGTGVIDLFCSNETGENFRVTSRDFTNANHEKITIEVSLSSFERGGFYWFDLVTPHQPSTDNDQGATLVEGWWETDSSRPQGTVSVGVTTYNRPADVICLLQQIISEPELVSITDDVYVVDQGTEHCQDEPDFEATKEELGARLHLIAQQNLGGSGGISRGLYESLQAGKSDYHLISDDDLKIEPEAILRAVAFADHCKKPTLVGGHMLSLTKPAHLHSWGERVDMHEFWWGSVLDQPYGANFDAFPLRIDGLLHRRVDVDYNGWWMELVPVSVIKKLGLSLPFFIKWDDAEFGLRAKAAGIPTVTMPGVACWHMPWTEKADDIDWQAYYHARNRIVSAMLHSATKQTADGVLDATYRGTVNHLLKQQYSAARFRNDSLEAILGGPQHMAQELATKRGEIQRIRKEYPDSNVHPDADSMPRVLSGRRAHFPLTRRKWETKFGQSFGRTIRFLAELMPVKPSAVDNPQISLSLRQATPRKMLDHDSALVTMADGTNVAMYVRTPHMFWKEIRRARKLCRTMRRQWDELSHQYRHAAAQVTSVEQWEDLFTTSSPLETETAIR